MTHFAFIKGINVGGNSKVDMKALKMRLEAAGFGKVETLLNSGNVALDSDSDGESVRATMEKIILEHFSVTTTVVVTDRIRLDEVLSQAPFAEGENDASKQLVYLMVSKPDPEGLKLIAANAKITEKHYLVGDVFYVYYHDGVGESKLTTNYIDRVFKTSSTGRNTNTLRKLLEKAAHRPG